MPCNRKWWLLARTACCLWVLSALAGCLTIEQIKARGSAGQAAAPPATTYDPRILLGPTQRVAVRRRDLANYTCGNLTMVCNSWGPSYECECQSAR